jgi:putative ABC transport system ATP-binding protein
MQMSTLPSFASVQIAGLNHWYGQGELRRMVLRDIDLSVERGKATFLMGPSGCGKTTLLTLVGALRSVQEGSVLVLGQELIGASEALMVSTRRRIGFVFQHHNLHRSLTMLQNVRMGLEAKGEAGAPDAGERCMEVIRLVGLADHAYKNQDQLSGGQKQRTAIARALVGNPELILADEPTAALDSKSGREAIELMQRLAAERGTTVLMVTHDNRILDIADRIVEIEDGQIVSEVEAGRRTPVRAAPRTTVVDATRG